MLTHTKQGGRFCRISLEEGPSCPTHLAGVGTMASARNRRHGPVVYFTRLIFGDIPAMNRKKLFCYTYV